MVENLSMAGLFGAAAIAAAVNSVAGGGSLISFPSLLAAGVPALDANATSTAALWPGTLSSALAYRKDTKHHQQLLWILLIPSVLGGLTGAVILVKTPPRIFELVVPFLVLFATLLFAGKDILAKGFRQGGGQTGPVSWRARCGGFCFQLLVALYGGYFGAGIGILMLGSLSVMGLRDIHQMNGLKTTLGTLINIIAFGYFAIQGIVIWPVAGVMAAGAILGGYGGARLAKRVNQQHLRWLIILLGLLVSVWLLIR